MNRQVLYRMTAAGVPDDGARFLVAGIGARGQLIELAPVPLCLNPFVEQLLVARTVEEAFLAGMRVSTPCECAPEEAGDVVGVLVRVLAAVLAAHGLATPRVSLSAIQDWLISLAKASLDGGLVQSSVEQLEALLRDTAPERIVPVFLEEFPRLAQKAGLPAHLLAEG